MKTFRMIGMALVAMVINFSVSSCSDDDDNFIPVDYSQDLVGTWTFHKPDMGIALQIKADGSVLSTGVIGHEYWENEQGKIEVENNKVCLTLEKGTIFEGFLEIIPGEAFVIVDEKRGERIKYTYCEKDLSKEMVGMWVKTSENENEIRVMNYCEDGQAIFTGFGTHADGYMVNDTTTYQVVGDLFMQRIPEDKNGSDTPKFILAKLVYTPDGTAYGDIMTKVSKVMKGNEEGEYVQSFLRVKETLNLANQKYDFIKTFVTNVKGLDKDIPFMGYTFNFAKMTSAGFDKFLKTILFAVEFPDANTIKYSCVVEGTPMSMECPIEVDGNKMIVKMSERYAAYRDIDFYAYQDKDDSQMHMYMPTYTFENFFSNIQVGVMAERGELDLTDSAAVEAVHKSIADAVETINVSFVMSKSK